MDEDFYTARVDKRIADLIPAYFGNRQKELARLRELLESQDCGEIATIAHRMIGVGTPYGFPYVTNMAKGLREVAIAKDTLAIRGLLDDYAAYLERVKVVYKEE